VKVTLKSVTSRYGLALFAFEVKEISSGYQDFEVVNETSLPASDGALLASGTAPFASIVLAPASSAGPPVSDATPFASNAAALEPTRIPRPSASGKPVEAVLEPLLHPETMAREKRETYAATLTFGAPLVGKRPYGN
jgi:hypothetical protein